MTAGDGQRWTEGAAPQPPTETPGPPPGVGTAPYPGPVPVGHAGPGPGPLGAPPPGWGPPPVPPPPPAPTGWAGLPPPPPRRTHRWGLGAFLLAEAVFLGVSILLGFAFSGSDGLTAGVVALSLAVPSVLAAVVAVVATVVRGHGPRIDLGLVWSWRDVGMGLAFGFGGLFITIPASIVYVSIVGTDATAAVGEAFADIRAGVALAVLVGFIVVVVAPLCEEVLYRGLLWGGVEKLAGRWWAFGVSTVIFALAHFEFTRTPLLLIVAIPVALARIYTGRLLASIVAHQVNNLLPGVVLALGLVGVVPLS